MRVSFKKIRISKPLIVFLLYTVVMIGIWNIFNVGQYVVALQGLQLGSGYAAVFVFVFVVRGFFYIPSLYFIIAASLLFPLPLSVVTYMAGILSSATLSYGIGFALRTKGWFPYFLQHVEKKSVQEKILKNGTRGVFFLQLIGLLDISNYVSGYLQISFRKFFVCVLIANSITATAYFVVYYFGLIDVLTWLQ